MYLYSLINIQFNSNIVNGCWTEWVDSTQCNAFDCSSPQIKSQFRNCSNPMPEPGGNDCLGEATRNVTCPGQGDKTSSD